MFKRIIAGVSALTLSMSMCSFIANAASQMPYQVTYTYSGCRYINNPNNMTYDIKQTVTNEDGYLNVKLSLESDKYGFFISDFYNLWGNYVEIGFKGDTNSLTVKPVDEGTEDYPITAKISKYEERDDGYTYLYVSYLDKQLPHNLDYEHGSSEIYFAEKGFVFADFNIYYDNDDSSVKSSDFEILIGDTPYAISLDNVYSKQYDINYVENSIYKDYFDTRYHVYDSSDMKTVTANPVVRHIYNIDENGVLYINSYLVGTLDLNKDVIYVLRDDMITTLCNDSVSVEVTSGLLSNLSINSYNYFTGKEYEITHVIYGELPSGTLDNGTLLYSAVIKPSTTDGIVEYETNINHDYFHYTMTNGKASGVEKTNKQVFEPTTTEITVGDADGNGTCDILDVITVNQVILGKLKLDDSKVQNVDSNKNGIPDALDPLHSLKYIVGLIEPEEFFI